MAVDAGTTDEQIIKSTQQGGPHRKIATPDDESPDDPTAAGSTAPRASRGVLRQGNAAGVLVVIAVSVLAGWLGYRDYDAHQTQRQRQAFIATARQEVINLTTLDYTHVESDVTRILNELTGTFHDDFEKRSPAFIYVVKRTQSKSSGTITEAGLQSADHDGGQVLVTVAVQQTYAAVKSEEPRLWRMRIGVKNVGDTMKVSNVEFIA
jgi:Mce-associated membrane protein